MKRLADVIVKPDGTYSGLYNVWCDLTPTEIRAVEGVSFATESGEKGNLLVRFDPRYSKNKICEEIATVQGLKQSSNNIKLTYTLGFDD